MQVGNDKIIAKESKEHIMKMLEQADPNNKACLICKKEYEKPKQGYIMVTVIKHTQLDVMRCACTKSGSAKSVCHLRRSPAMANCAHTRYATATSRGIRKSIGARSGAATAVSLDVIGA